MKCEHSLHFSFIEKKSAFILFHMRGKMNLAAIFVKQRQTSEEEKNRARVTNGDNSDHVMCTLQLS